MKDKTGYGLWTTTKDGEQFSDKDVAKFVKKHLRLRDRFRISKIAEASLLSFDVFLKEARFVSDKKNWKFFEKGTKFEWIEDEP